MPAPPLPPGVGSPGLGSKRHSLPPRWSHHSLLPGPLLSYRWRFPPACASQPLPLLPCQLCLANAPHLVDLPESNRVHDLMRAFGSHIAHQMRVAAARRRLPASVFGPRAHPPVVTAAPVRHRFGDATLAFACLRSTPAVSPPLSGHGHPHRRAVDSAYTEDFTAHDAYSPKCLASLGRTQVWRRLSSASSFAELQRQRGSLPIWQVEHCPGLWSDEAYRLFQCSL